MFWRPPMRSDVHVILPRRSCKDIFLKTLLVAILWFLKTWLQFNFWGSNIVFHMFALWFVWFCFGRVWTSGRFMSMLDTGGAADVQSQCPEQGWTKWLWIAAAAWIGLGVLGWNRLKPVETPGRPGFNPSKEENRFLERGVFGGPPEQLSMSQSSGWNRAWCWRVWFHLRGAHWKKSSKVPLDRIRWPCCVVSGDHRNNCGGIAVFDLEIARHWSSGTCFWCSPLAGTGQGSSRCKGMEQEKPLPRGKTYGPLKSTCTVLDSTQSGMEYSSQVWFLLLSTCQTSYQPSPSEPAAWDNTLLFRMFFISSLKPQEGSVEHLFNHASYRPLPTDRLPFPFGLSASAHGDYGDIWEI